MPDPGVLDLDGTYYAFGTTGGERKADGRIFTVLRSTDLVHWQELGGALVPPSDDPVYQYWAPEAAANDGRYYLYYAMGGKEEEKFAIRVAVSEKPEGPYRDTGEPLVDCTGNRFTIDAHPFRDDDGQWYLFYARNYPNTEGGYLPGTGLAVDKLVGMTKLAGQCKMVLRAKYPWTLYEAHRRMNVYDATFDWNTIEGPFVRKHNGKYYCFYSGANYQTTRYGVDFAVADNVLGPYTGQGREARVLKGVAGHVRGPGHHSIVLGPDRKTEYIVYHAWDPQMKVRQMWVDRLVWTPAGPKCAGPTWRAQPVPRER
jgi:GH43 family beta-xylosidase